MTEFNKYQIYSLNNTENTIVDDVDHIISQIDRLQDYNSVLEFVSKNLGTVEEAVQFEFPKTNKSIGVILKEDAIECFGLVGDTNFYKKRLAKNRTKGINYASIKH